MKTRSKHHITLNNNGLVKEFCHGRDYFGILAHSKMTHDARLPNVEQGVISYTSITITTIGRRVRDAIRHRGLDKQTALDGVERAVQQLHAIGMAHCDICVDNIFVDLETGVVFLGGLEYCRPVGDAPPVDIRRRGDPAARTAQELDELQLARLQEEDLELV
jgi:tRNA A-37 threonylcarbamoyl transferase component Bud32